MERLWTIKEIMATTGYSDKTVNQAIQRGELRSVKLKSAVASARTRNGKSVQTRRYVKQEWLVEWLGYDPLAEAERARREAEARREKVAFVDRTGQRYGRLVAVRWERRQVKQESGRRAYRTHVYWRCQCDCGKTRELPSSWFSIYANRTAEFSCEACSQASESAKLSAAAKRRQEQGRLFVRNGEGSPYEMNYREYRGQFTPAQQARYEELMEGRQGEAHEAEAVDVVMREPQPGACCERCFRPELSTEEARPVEGRLIRSETREPPQLADQRREKREAGRGSEKRESRLPRATSAAERLSLLRAVYQRRQAELERSMRVQQMVA